MAKAGVREKRLASVTDVETVVKCSQCGKRFNIDDEVESDGFFVLYGDISVGANGEMLFGNIDDKGKLIGSTVCCRTMECIQNMMKMVLPKSLTRETLEGGGA
jgi:hypothetical protein